MKPDDLFRASAFDLAQAVQQRTLSAEVLVRAHVARIERINPAINALVASQFAQALERARIADERASAGDRSPLLGVPFSVKATLALEGMPHTAGSLTRRGVVADRHATAVQRLVDAGAIPIGLANTAELGFWIETDNRLYGRTSNPHDVRRTSGGSSGGDAALVAAGCVPFALASDGFGSNTIAGALSGVVAHKPTGGLVPLTGVYPEPPTRARRYTTVGVLTRSARDVHGLLQILAGPDGQDQSVRTVDLPSPTSIDWTWRRVMVCEALGVLGNRPSRDVLRQLKQAQNVLRVRGASIEYWRPSQFAWAGEIWLSMVHEGYGLNDTFLRTLTSRPRASLALEVLRGIGGTSQHSGAALAMAALERVTKGSYSRIQHFCAEGRRLQQRINAMLGDGGVLLMPAYPTVAPLHGGTWRDPRGALYAALMNVLELPAITVPMGHTRQGLPIGILVVGAQGADSTCISAAMALENAAGRWSPIEP